jgi:hypothetical protein
LKLELPDPSLAGPVERSNQIDFLHGKDQQVDYVTGTCAEDLVAGAGAKD